MSETTHHLTAETVDTLMHAAVAAPSMHNAQPWRFRRHGDALEVYADPTRGLPVGDPSSRNGYIGCGAALLNLRLAAAASGLEAVVRLLPSADDPLHLATVSVAGPRTATAQERELYDAIPRRHTNRWPFEERPIAANVLDELRSAAAVEGADLHVPDVREADWLLELINDVDREQQFDARYREELRRWSGSTDATRADGIPESAAGPRDPEHRLPLRDFTAGRSVPERPYAPFEKAPQLAVLLTRTDHPVDWLRAGQALQRVLLTATARGIAASFLNQPVEREQTRPMVRDPLYGFGYPHMVLRLGYPTVEVPPTPRRPIPEVFEQADD